MDTNILECRLVKELSSSNYYLYKMTADRFVSLCAAVQRVLKEEPNVVRLSTPISICGDIHGQFTDLWELFNVGGKVPDKNFLFLGDYVDRGRDSVSTMALLMGLKVHI